MTKVFVLFISFCIHVAGYNIQHFTPFQIHHILITKTFDNVEFNVVKQTVHTTETRIGTLFK